MSLPGSARPPYALAVLLIVGGFLGWFAAFQLTVEKFVLLEDPNASLNCDFNILVQCQANLNSAQGEVFGFPNPLLGLGGFVAPIAVGAALLAGARFARWFWLLLAAGISGALGFVIWLIAQSVFVIGTLCPWCMVVWSVTIPLFWAVWLHVLGTGIVPLPRGARRVFRSLYGWVPAITVASYLVVAVVAQVRLDVLRYLV